jgi:hypothetical protein
VYGSYGGVNYVSIIANDGFGYLYATRIVSLGSDPGTSAAGLATGDFDKDGDLDIVVPANAVTVLRNDGGFSFSTFSQRLDSPSPTQNVRSVTTGDVDGDGDDDIIACAFSGGSNAYMFYFVRSVGGMSFSKSGFGPLDLSSLVGGDLDGDSDPDFLGFQNGTMHIFANDGTGFMNRTTSPYARAPKEAALVDIDQDGDLDVLTVDGMESKVFIAKNQGGLQFSAPTFLPIGQSPWGLATGDFNGDGAADIAATNLSEKSLSIYRSQP